MKTVAGTDKYDPFGFDYYNAPKTDNNDKKITGFSPGRGKLVGCFYPVE
jgi:hypothetical protein